MNQEHNNSADINNQAREAMELPELISVFDNINKLENNPNEELFLNDEGLPPTEEIEEGEQEEIPEELVEEEEEEEEAEEVILQKPVKEKKGDRYKKLQNDKYRALAEKEEALQRVAELEDLVKESLNSGTYHYSKNVYAELDKAKEDKRKAFEEGDFDAYLNADIALIKSVNAINDLEKWANENEPKQNTRNNYQEDRNSLAYQEVVYQEIAKDWIDSHPYLKPNSRSYNPKLASNVTDFINELDHNLHNNRQSDAIFSDDYFDTIDNYIHSLTTPKRDNSKNIESLSNVSGVRNSSSGTRSKSSTSQITLTQDEKQMAHNMGVSPKEWLKYKIEENMKDNRTGNNYGR